MIQPTEHNILIQEVPQELKLSSGFELLQPDDEPVVGLVIAVGPGRWHSGAGKRIPVQPQPGDKIRYTPYAGARINHEGEDYIILPEDEVLLVLS